MNFEILRHVYNVDTINDIPLQGDKTVDIQHHNSLSLKARARPSILTSTELIFRLSYTVKGTTRTAMMRGSRFKHQRNRERIRFWYGTSENKYLYLMRCTTGNDSHQ